MKKERSLEFLLNGEGTRYEIILRSLRQSLRGILGEQGSKYGCISFYEGDLKTKKIQMNVFPLNPEVAASNMPNNKKLRQQVFSRINKPRAYSELHHLEHFRKYYSTTQHMILSVSNEQSLNFDSEKVNGRTWEDFVYDEQIKDNLFDLFCFESNQVMFNTLSLPVLSSPCILLTLPFSQKHDVRTTILPIREVVDHYLITYIIQEIQKDLNLNAIDSRDELVKRFVDEFIQVSLPDSYIHNGKEKLAFDWFDGNDGNDGCFSEFSLNLDGDEIKFNFPSFCWEDGAMFHQTNLFESKKEQMKEMLESLFGLVLSNWRSLNSKKLIVEQKVKPIVHEIKQSLSNINISSIESELQKANNWIQHLSKSVSELRADHGHQADNALFYRLVKSNGKVKKYWTFRYNGNDIITDDTRKGWAELHLILEKRPNEVTIQDFQQLERGVIDEDAGIVNNDFQIMSSETVLNDRISYVPAKTSLKKEVERKWKEIAASPDEMGADDYKEYAKHLASYIGILKGDRSNYHEEKSQLENVMELIQIKYESSKFIGGETFEDFQFGIFELQKSPVNQPSKKIYDLYIKRLQTILNRIHEHGKVDILKEPYLKIGATSRFTPPDTHNDTWDLRPNLSKST